MPFEIDENVGFYQVLAQLGQGGMATVFKAHHTVLDRDVALKVLNPAFMEDPNFTVRFRREARAIAALDHPHIVPVFDFAEHRGIPYLVMKYIDGETLKSRLWRQRASPPYVREIVEAVGSALGYAHQHGVLHRDIKPSNVLLANDGGIFLSDFGLARMVAEGTSTLSREMLIGTPQYISPEQAVGRPDLDARTDIYSLGIVVYELVTGQVPFDADTPISIIHDHLYNPPAPPSSLDSEVDQGLEQVILKCLAKRREERYSTVGEMLEDFRAAVAKGPVAPTSFHSLDALPEAAPPSRPTVLVSGNGLHFLLAGERMLVGRKDPQRGISPDIDLTEAEPVDPKTGKARRTVHREHVRLTLAEDGWHCEIIPGKEGNSWLNDQPLLPGKSHLLRIGDWLKLSAVELEVL